jgi:uncharacterized RDD family membrane protein YckC
MPWDPIGQTDSQGPVGNPPPAMSGYGWWRGHQLAHWGQRVAATLIDVAVASIAAGTIGAIINDWLLVFLLVWGGLETYGVDGKGTSLGKKALGLTIIVPRINPETRQAWACYPRWTTLAGRFAAHFLDLFVLYIGFLRPLWNERRQTWADSLVNTLVVVRWPHDQMPLVEDTGGIRDISPG